MILSLCCSVVIMLYCYCVALLLFVLSYVLIVCTVPLPPGVNPIAVDNYIITKNLKLDARSTKYIKSINLTVYILCIQIHFSEKGSEHFIRLLKRSSAQNV